MASHVQSMRNNAAIISKTKAQYYKELNHISSGKKYLNYTDLNKASASGIFIEYKDKLISTQSTLSANQYTFERVSILYDAMKALNKIVNDSCATISEVTGLNTKDLIIKKGFARHQLDNIEFLLNTNCAGQSIFNSVNRQGHQVEHLVGENHLIELDILNRWYVVHDDIENPCTIGPNQSINCGVSLRNEAFVDILVGLRKVYNADLNESDEALQKTIEASVISLSRGSIKLRGLITEIEILMQHLQDNLQLLSRDELSIKNDLSTLMDLDPLTANNKSRELEKTLTTAMRSAVESSTLPRLLDFIG